MHMSFPYVLFRNSSSTGTKHRDPQQGKFEKTLEAQLHNQFLLNVKCIIEWTKRRNSHLIVVIENPEAKLREMPLMKELCDRLGLQQTTVHYCAFGADEKKPTNLWSNVSTKISADEKNACQHLPHRHLTLTALHTYIGA